ncbi:unnamed protein product [Schistosoma bovis]|nr:unnamed protein product [Schistosoma bovis]
MSLSKFSNLFLDDLPIHRFSTNDLNVYLQDIINQLLHIKESEDPVNVKLFLSKYFEHVVNGTHTIHREFKYISAIPYNRITFLFNLWNAFMPLKDKDFTIEEFYTIVQLFCFDFPGEILSQCQKTLNIVHNSTISVNQTFPMETMNILVDLPNKYVDSIEFLNFTRGLYKESTLLLPPKLVMHKCVKTYLFHSEFNLYGLFTSLATDHLLIKEIGFPQVHGS